MSKKCKKSYFEKTFSGSSNHGYEVSKKRRKKNYDIFMNDLNKKKKKKKKKHKGPKIDNIISNTIGESDLSELIMFNKIEDTGITTFDELSENARGLFVVEILLDENKRGLLPVFVSSDGKVSCTETAGPVEEVVARYMASENENLSDIDIQMAADKLKQAGVIEGIYNIDMAKLLKQISILK